MLEIYVPESEQFDERTQEFIASKAQKLRLEHSLISISKWESIYCKCFLDRKKEKTYEETIDYVRCMTIDKNVDKNVYYALSRDNIESINSYIEAPMSATYFGNRLGNSVAGTLREQVTSELIYYWMVAFNIPMECEKWHINRLLNLIEICNIKNTPPKKMSKNQIMRRNAALNAARCKNLGTKG